MSWAQWRARLPPQGCPHSSPGPTKRRVISLLAVTGGCLLSSDSYVSGATLSCSPHEVKTLAAGVCFGWNQSCPHRECKTVSPAWAGSSKPTVSQSAPNLWQGLADAPTNPSPWMGVTIQPCYLQLLQRASAHISLTSCLGSVDEGVWTWTYSRKGRRSLLRSEEHKLDLNVPGWGGEAGTNWESSTGIYTPRVK